MNTCWSNNVRSLFLISSCMIVPTERHSLKLSRRGTRAAYLLIDSDRPSNLLISSVLRSLCGLK